MQTVYHYHTVEYRNVYQPPQYTTKPSFIPSITNLIPPKENLQNPSAPTTISKQITDNNLSDKERADAIEFLSRPAK
jgi:hypothetical protein